MKGLVIGIAAVLVIGGGLAGWLLRDSPPATETSPATQPTTRVAETSGPATQPKTVATFLDFVREIQPAYPTTQPLEYVVKFAESAKLIVEHPLYIDSRRDIWITHADAPPLDQTLKNAADEQVHVVPFKVAYVHWRPGERGKWEPLIVIDKGDRRFDVLHPDGQRHPISVDGHCWSRAVEWNGLTFVPMPQAVTAFDFRGERVTSQNFHFTGHDLIEAPSGVGDESDRVTHAYPMIIPDLRGVLAFIPAGDRGPGAPKTARYVDGKWTILDLKDSEKQLQVIPLLDGSLLRILQGEADKVRLDLATLEAVDVDREKILGLVDRLSELEQAERDKAFAELQKYGQGIWPILEPIAEDQPPEARIRIRQLLKNKIRPTLAGMTIVDDRLQVVERQTNNTVVFRAPQGVRIANERDQSSVIPGAWIAAGPWTGIQLLSQRMTHELQPGKDVVRFVGGDWIVTSAALGPRQWVGNSFVDLLDNKHRRFMYVLGSDRASRWYFTEHDPAGPRGLDQPVLIVDRRLPDATPRLPVWNWHEQKATMGWDEKGFPGMRAGGAFVLDKTEWRTLDLKKEKFYTRPDEMPPATQPTSPPATTQAAHGPSLLLTPDGTAYFGGRDVLIVVRPDGGETRWPLPPEATGDWTPQLVRAEDGRLFLFNQAGRIVRLRPTPGAAEPFELEAVFTKGIPNERQPRRVWLDPAGRLIILVDDHRMAILFPEGRIPRPVSLLMPAGTAEEEW